MKRFNIIKKFNKVNDDFINSFFKEKNISKYKKYKILEKYNTNKDTLYYIEIIDFDNKKIKFKNFLDMIYYLNDLKKYLVMYITFLIILSGYFTVMLINNLKNWESSLINTSFIICSFFLIYYFFINIKDFNNLIKEIKNDNKIYLEEIKNDNLIDL